MSSSKRARTETNASPGLAAENEKLRAENEKLKEENGKMILQTMALATTTQQLDNQLDKQRDPFTYVVITPEGKKCIMTSLQSAKFLLREHVLLFFRLERSRDSALRCIDRLAQEDKGLSLYPERGAHTLNYQKVPYFNEAEYSSICQCGRCAYKFGEEKTHCFACRVPLCKGQRVGTVCYICRGKAGRDGMETVFNKGKDDDGQWIDPGNGVSLPTCEICGMLRSEFNCDRLGLAMGNRCTRTGKTLAQWKAENPTTEDDSA